MPDAMAAPAVGDLLAYNYRILGTAGTGGMGVVYRAQDLKLERTVALKFLPADLDASERDRERFLREARTASSLDHPNIGVIHAIENTPDDRSFIVMAFYEGQSLAQRLRSGPMPPAEAANIVVQVLKGLDYAHTRGIEHRDIKPSNIMLTQLGSVSQSGSQSGQIYVKIVDFGLAHVTQQTASVTKGISGTVAYMSPERTLGRPIDSRSDIWAVGIVLMEALTGQNSFQRDTIPATIFSILNEPPRNLEAVPDNLQRIIYRALSKDPERRYQTCAEMLRDLELALPSLPVIVSPEMPAPQPRRSRESSETKRSREFASLSAWGPPPPKTTWQPWLLGLAAVVLLGAASLLIPAVREKALGLLPEANPENHRPKQAAYEGYLAALAYIDRYDKPGNLDRAIQALNGSLKTDPLFALGYAQRGYAYLIKYKLDLDQKWLDMATADCQQAERLDTRIPTIYTTLAFIHLVRGNHDLALQEFQQALDINPRDPVATQGLAQSYELSGRRKESEEAYKRAISLRPDDWNGYTLFGIFLQRQGRYPEAIIQYQKAADLAPASSVALNNLGSTYSAINTPASLSKAEEVLKHSISIDPSYPALNGLATIYMSQKRFAEAASTLVQALKIDDRDYVVWDNLRSTYESLNDKQAAEQTLLHELQVVEQRLTKHPQDGLARARAAVLYAKRANKEKALLNLNSAIALDSTAPENLQTIAEAYAWLGDREHALQYVDRCLKAGVSRADIQDDPDLSPIFKGKQ